MVTSTVCHPHKTIKGQTLDWLKHLFQCPWRQGLFFFLPAKRCLTEHLLSIQFIWTFSYITILRTRASFRSFSKEWHRQNKCLLPSSHACVPFALFLSLQVASARMCVCVFCCLALIFQQNKLIRALPATLPPFFFSFFFWQRLLRGEKWWSKSKIQLPVFCFRRHTVYCTDHKTPKQPPDAAAITLHQNTLSRIQK